MNKEEKKFLQEQMRFIPVGGKVIEIGSWAGGSAEQLGKGIKKYKKNTAVNCIDTWNYAAGENVPELVEKARGRDIFHDFEQRMKPYPCTSFHGKNEAFLDMFDAVDFLFIDGDHSYAAVLKDIQNWLPKMAPGSIMCGHDYGRYGVKEAVDEMFKKVELPARTIWKVIING